MQVRLKVLNGSSAGKELKVAFDEFVVGRSDDCHLRPKSDAISRRHCVIRLRDEQVFVEDLGSRNGTYLNEQRLEEETEARQGDVLRIGKLEFTFEIEKPAEALVDGAPASQVVEEESWAEDDDITKWLQTEEPVAGRRDPETRQFRLDETERVALETVLKPATETAPNKAGDKKVEAGSAVGDEKDEKAKAEKRQPGKLPVRQSNSNNSREAAADMLRRFFNRP